MKRTKDDPYAVDESSEERRFRYRFEQAIVYELRPAPDGTGQRLVFRNSGALHDLYLSMVNGGDEGYLSGVRLFLRNAGHMLRSARSQFLNLLAGQLHLIKPTSAPLRECEVSDFARFVRGLLPAPGEDVSRGHFGTEILLAWAEDAHTGLPDVGVEAQPTALIRGILLAPSLDQRRAILFWDKAALSDKFPCRIFSDPCPYDEGVLFSSWHIRAFGQLFAVVPPAAVQRFAAHMGDNAIHKMTLREREMRGVRRWVPEPVPAEANDRERVFRCIVGMIDNAERRAQVTAALRLSA